MDKLTGIEIFTIAIEKGSLVAAARHFNLSPSMAGKHVTALEEQLGTKLLLRSTRQLQPTEAGRNYYYRCKRILEDLNEANREASDSPVVFKGALRIAAPVTFGAMHLGPVIATYLKENPQVRVEMLLDDLFIDLRRENIDFAIRIGQLEDSNLITRRLAPCRMVLCTSPAFAKKNGGLKTLEQVCRAPRLAFNELGSDLEWIVIDKENKQHVIDGPVSFSANNTQILLAAAEEGVGIAYGPSFVFGESIIKGKVIPLLHRYRIPELRIQAVFPERNLTAKARRFIDILASDFGERPAWDRALKVWTE